MRQIDRYECCMQRNCRANTRNKNKIYYQRAKFVFCNFFLPFRMYHKNFSLIRVQFFVIVVWHSLYLYYFISYIIMSQQSLHYAPSILYRLVKLVQSPTTIYTIYRNHYFISSCIIEYVVESEHFQI